MRRIFLALAFVCLAACGYSQTVIHGLGDPRNQSPIPSCVFSKVYVDDISGTIYTPSGFPCVWGPASGGGGGNGALSLVAASSGAAAANATTINNCLSIGGSVCYVAGAPGTVYYVNGPLVQYSNTFFKSDPGVILKSNNNTTIWMNYQNTQPFTNSSGYTWTSGSTATINFPSHGFTVGSGAGFGGQWVYIQGSASLLQSSTGATSYTSGASACTDGTQNVSLTNATGTVFPNVGTITVTGGVPTGNITYGGGAATTWGFGAVTNGTVATCTGTAVFNTTTSLGNADPPYSCVCRVVSVTDANNLVVQLNRIPAVAPIGTFYVKKVDVNLQAENLTFDSSNNTAPKPPQSHAAILLGVHRFNYYGRYMVINPGATGGFGFAGQALDDAHMSGFTDPEFDLKNGIQFYGPLTHSSISNTTGYSNDDIVTMMTIDTNSFANYMPNGGYGGGDLLDDVIDGVEGLSAGHCATIYPFPPYYTDKVFIKNGLCHATAASTIAQYAFKFSGSAGEVGFENIHCEDDRTVACIGTSVQAAKLSLLNISGPSGNNTSNIILYEPLDPANLIRNFVVDGLKWQPKNNGDIAFKLDNGEIDNFDMSHFFVNMTATTDSNVIVSSVAANQNIFVHDGTVNPANGSLVQVTTAGPKVKATNVTWNAASGTIANAAMLQATAATTFYPTNNTVLGGWILGLSGSIAYTLNSGGGNQLNTAVVERFVGAVSGSPTVTVNNGSSDVLVDISSAKYTPAVGSCVKNFNATYGVGPMCANGTAFFPIYTSATFSAAASVGTISASAGATNNGITIGTYTSSTTGTVTVVITPGFTSRGTGFNCVANDLTTPADTITQTASSTTTCTLTGTVVSGDVVQLKALPL